MTWRSPDRPARRGRPEATADGVTGDADAVDAAADNQQIDRLAIRQSRISPSGRQAPRCRRFFRRLARKS
jgi:hypothetical protein